MSDRRGCGHPSHGNSDHDCAPFVAPPPTMTAGEYLENLARAWDAGWLCRDVGSNRNPYRPIPPGST